MADGLPAADFFKTAAESMTGVDIAAPARTAVRRNFRREKSRFIPLQMRSPALLISAAPERHGFRIVQHRAVLVVQVQLTLRLPSDVRELQHGHGDVALGDGLFQLFALLNARDKVCEVKVRHRVAADQVRRSSLVAGLELSSLL